MDGDREGEAEEAGGAPGAGEGAARPGAGWAHVTLGLDDEESAGPATFAAK